MQAHLRYIPVRRLSCYLKLLHLPDSPTDCQIDRLTVGLLDWLSHCLTGCLPDYPTDLLTFSLANGARVSFLSTYVQNMLPLPGQTTFAWPGLGSRQATSHTSVLHMCVCVNECIATDVRPSLKRFVDFISRFQFDFSSFLNYLLLQPLQWIYWKERSLIFYALPARLSANQFLHFSNIPWEYFVFFPYLLRQPQFDLLERVLNSLVCSAYCN